MVLPLSSGQFLILTIISRPQLKKLPLLGSSQIGVPRLSPPLSGWVTLGTFHNFSEPQFIHTYPGIGISFTQSFWNDYRRAYVHVTDVGLSCTTLMGYETQKEGSEIRKTEIQLASSHLREVSLGGSDNPPMIGHDTQWAGLSKHSDIKTTHSTQMHFKCSHEHYSS